MDAFERLTRYGIKPSVQRMAIMEYLMTHRTHPTADEVIKKWLTTFCRRFFNQQFKRSCLPDGPKVGSVSLSPRGDWMMPSDACSTEWLKECEEL